MSTPPLSTDLLLDISYVWGQLSAIAYLADQLQGLPLVRLNQKILHIEETLSALSAHSEIWNEVRRKGYPEMVNILSHTRGALVALSLARASRREADHRKAQHND